MLTGSWTYRTVPTLGWYKIFLKPLVWLIFVFIKEQNNIDNLDSNSQLGVYSHNHKTRGLILSQNNVLLLLFENGIHFWASSLTWLVLNSKIYFSIWSWIWQLCNFSNLIHFEACFCSFQQFGQNKTNITKLGTCQPVLSSLCFRLFGQKSQIATKLTR